MSAGYASRLSEYPNKGVCGLPERTDTQRSYLMKIQQLISLIQQSQYIVILTGAGISTSAGIPDFRGPNGIWTIEKQQHKEHGRSRSTSTTGTGSKKRKRSAAGNVEDESNTKDSVETKPVTMNFAGAKPTLTHRIITKLVTTNRIQFVITQNVDGLHRRSGLSRNKHAIVHGCAFTEKCDVCSTEFFRDYDIGGMSFQLTGRSCDVCTNGKLRDTLLDWEDPLPEDDFLRAEYHCSKADLMLCLGTSLRIQPVNQLPFDAKQFVIVNLQQTPIDKYASLIIRERVDVVLHDIYKGLGYNDNEITSIESDSTQIERVWKMPDNPCGKGKDKKKISKIDNMMNQSNDIPVNHAFGGKYVLEYTTLEYSPQKQSKVKSTEES
jgi:NAD+-dependent protein deacetylase sirtuin 6